MRSLAQNCRWQNEEVHNQPHYTDDQIIFHKEVVCTTTNWCVAHFNKSVTTGVDVGFDPETYMVTEGNQRDLRVVVSGSYDIPVEVLLSTTGLSATGNYDTKCDLY